jgi:DNA polymerase-1
MKIIKRSRGFYLTNVYDTMLVEQLSTLGLAFTKASLSALVLRHLGLYMPKEPRDTFGDYGQKYEEFQIEYAANDVVPLHLIRDLQWSRVQKEGLENAARLEFEFIKPLCEMELNGIHIDVDKWRIIMTDVEKERIEVGGIIREILSEVEDQNTLFGVSLVNIDSNAQLKSALNKYGIPVEKTDVGALEKHAGVPIVDAILDYRKANKLISTYAETLLAKISKYTGRLHTDFRQMIATGRLSSSNPNLQNIPKQQRYRSCFISSPGYSLITADQSGAELRILGNLSKDPIFIEAYATGQDLHTRTASEIFGVPYDKVDKNMRGAAKSINFGLIYGMSSVGLSKRLKITKKSAEDMINKYFNRYRGIKRYLDKAARDAVSNRFTTTVSGRKRYYNMPAFDHPDRKKIQSGIERQGMNAAIQGGDADTIKEAMILVVNRLEGYDAKLLLCVHDELVIEVRDDQRYEVSEIVVKAIKDGFGRYFTDIPMETEALIGKSWLKGLCENKVDGTKCGHNEMKFILDEKYGSKLVCSKCGGGQE